MEGLSYGVTVALQILVLSVKVRILVAQQNRKGKEKENEVHLRSYSFPFFLKSVSHAQIQSSIDGRVILSKYGVGRTTGLDPDPLRQNICGVQTNER